MMRAVTSTFTPEQIEKLEALAAYREGNKSAVLRELLDRVEVEEPPRINFVTERNTLGETTRYAEGDQVK